MSDQTLEARVEAPLALQELRDQMAERLGNLVGTTRRNVTRSLMANAVP